MNTKKLISVILLLTIILNTILNFCLNIEVQALSETYTQTLKSGIEAFPESYQEKLKLLSELHPDWEFKAYYTGIDWNELTSSQAENRCRKNTIYKGNVDPNVLCICGFQGDSNYFCGSANTVNFYLDPRNFLEESMIFQFLELSYSNTVTEKEVLGAVADTYLDAKIEYEGETYTYAKIIVEAAEEAQVNPMHIVATIFQELGRKKEIPNGISGTYPGYEGLYNFFNYGATDGVTDGKTPTEKGLEKARSMNWTNPYFALKDGVKTVLANNYISAGQTTKYFYKFDVVGNDILKENETKTYESSLFFNHQYMTNLQDPCGQAGTLFTYYTNCGLINGKLTFVIPVYDNMPEKTYYPTALTQDDGELYYINTSKIFGVTFRSAASTSSTDLGSLYKYNVVAVQEISGNWAKVKFKKASSYDTENKKWNYDEIIGYVTTTYIEKLELPVEEPVEPETPEVPETGTDTETDNNENITIKEENLVCNVNTTISKIKEKYSEAIVKNLDGIEITEDVILGTGYKMIDGEKEYTIIVSGDVTGDGKVDSMDMYNIIQHILGTTLLEENYFLAANTNNDEIIDSMDMYNVIQIILKN